MNIYKQITKSKSKGDQFSASIKYGRIKREDTALALKSTIWKTLEYPMALTSLTKSQWNNTIKNIIMNSLPKMGTIRTFP